MELSEVTPAMVESYDAHMARVFNMIIANKADVPLMDAIGFGFEAARAFGAKLPTAKQWMDDYWTMFGPLLVRPKNIPTDPLVRFKIMAHEAMHAEQYHRGDESIAQVGSHVAFAWLYLTNPEARWRLELQATRAEMEVHYALTGQFPPMAELCRMVEGGYALKAEYKDAHESAIASHGAQLLNEGQILTPAGRAAFQWFKNHDIAIKGNVKL